MRHIHLLLSITLITLLSLTTAVVSAKGTAEMWPDTKYDPKIPTFKQVLGYDVGERISNHAQMMRYFKALQQAAPNRISLHEYAKSWQSRELIYAVVANQDNLSQLEDLAKSSRLLSDPRLLSAKDAKKLVTSLPSSVWLQYAVHGNEISGTDAAMFTAYFLLAAIDSPEVKTILDTSLVFIDPLQNPDGRERFTSRYYATVGLEHSSDRYSAEHNEPWPRGRSNHYLFDMNRDWLAVTQPETQGKIAAINYYKPQVIVDLHEMSGDQSYYFAPAAEPFNPHMTADQIDNMNRIGRNNGKHFDNFGFDYFTREIFDAFYPGYGDSWPTFYGASASTYEAGSARGQQFTKSDGSILTFWDTVQRQFVASISTAEGTAQERLDILSDFYQYQVDAIAAGKKQKERVYIMPATKNREGNHRLATLMAEHGVEVKQAKQAFSICGKRYPAGAYWIDSAQPRGKFVTTTMTQQVDMSDAFLALQEQRRARNLNDQIYDVTGWSLPLMFNVETDSCSRAPSVDAVLVDANQSLAGKVNNPDAKVAFVVAWGDMAAGRFLTAALRQGIVLKSSDDAFVLENGDGYPAGSLVIEKRLNGPQLLDQIQQIAGQTGAIVDGVDSSWVVKGPSFGSDRTVTMVAPKIAIAWDEPTSSLSAGNTRFVIERQLGYPVTAIRTSTLTYADLSDYQVLILPEGNYQGTLGNAGAETLQAWVNAGGVLIALGSANRFLSDDDNGLLAIDRELAYRDGDSASQEADNGKVSGQYFTEKSDLQAAITPAKTSPDYVAGVLANVHVDTNHWMTAGVSEKLVTVASGSDIYTPITLDNGKNLLWFAAEDEVLASGYLWQETQSQLAYKPVLVYQPYGDGMVIGYTQSPTFRAYLEGMNLLLTNSIFRAAAHAQK